MILKQNKQLRFNSNFIDFYPLNPQLKGLISFIYFFLHYAYFYVLRQGVLGYIKEVSFSDCNHLYELVTLSFDSKNNIAYFSEESDNYESKINTPELEQLAEEGNIIELCRRGIADHEKMTKDNFFYLLIAWGKILEELPPFALLYEDDKNWFDVLPFDSKEAMEKFVADHTQPE